MALELLVWLLLIYFMGRIVVDSFFFDSIVVFLDSLPFKLAHYIADFLSCLECSTFWIGVAMAYFLYSPVQQILDINFILFDGALASISIFIIDRIVRRLT